MSRWVAIGVALGCVACPFKTGSNHAKVSECKANLKAWYTSQRAFQQEHDRYSPLLPEVGFRPERGNRYLYMDDARISFTDRSAPEERGTPRDTGIQPDVYKFGSSSEVPLSAIPSRLAGGVPLGLSGKCPACEISAVCVGQLDRDATLDVWSISTRKRTAPDGSSIEAGQPFNDVNDMEE